MIKIRLDKNYLGEPIFRLGLDKCDEDNKLLKRAILEAKKHKGIYNYSIPMKYFLPIFSNLKKERIKLDTRSYTEFFEFADELEERFFYSTQINPKYMRTWRKESCPNIFKIEIDKDSMEISKRIAFKKININKQ